MWKQRAWIGLLAFVSLPTGCGPKASPTVPPSLTTTPESPPPSIAQEGILISEALLGVHGVNNNLEFIELYNAGVEAADLNGWSLWYRLADGKEEELVHAWDQPADVPGHGHYLLVRTGQDVGNIGDAEFEVSLFEMKGGLALRDPRGEVVDSLVWGEGPADYCTGSAAAVPEGSSSLERLPVVTAGRAARGRLAARLRVCRAGHALFVYLRG